MGAKYKRFRWLMIAIFTCVMGVCLAFGLAACSSDSSGSNSINLSLDYTSVTMQPGETRKITATATTDDGEPYSGGYNWTKSGDAISISASNDTCIITAESVGQASVTVTAGSYSVTCTVNVIETDTTGNNPEVVSVSLNYTTLGMYVGEKETLTATVQMSETGMYSGGYSWTVVEGENCVEISENGSSCNVTALAVGTAKVRVTVGGKSADCEITVSEAEVTGITLSNSTLELAVGEEKSITVTVTMSDGGESAAYEYECADETVVKVTKNEDGSLTVTALAEGDAVIKITAGSKSAECTVKVTTDSQGSGTALESVSLDHGTLDLVLGGQDGVLNATVSPAGSYTFVGTEWASSDESVAIVAANGATATVTAVGVGTASVTVTIDGTVYATCLVTVTENTTWVDPKEAIVDTWVGYVEFYLEISSINVGGTFGGDVTIEVTDSYFTLTISNLEGVDTMGKIGMGLLGDYLTGDLEVFYEYDWTYDETLGQYVVEAPDDAGLNVTIYISMGTLEGKDFLYLTFEAEITMEGMALGIDIEDQSVKRQSDEAVMRKIGLSETEANIFKGKTETVTAEIYYTDGSTATEYGGLTIESSDNNVATAVIDGNTMTITAVEAGTATITVKINENVYATISVNVVYVTGVTFTENETEVTEITLGAAGDTTEITANVTLSDGTEYSGGWTWTTDAGEVATVEKVQTGTILRKDTNKATVTAAGDGTATITLTLDDGSAWTLGVAVGTMVDPKEAIVDTWVGYVEFYLEISSINVGGTFGGDVTIEVTDSYFTLTISNLEGVDTMGKIGMGLLGDYLTGDLEVFYEYDWTYDETLGQYVVEAPDDAGLNVTIYISMGTLEGKDFLYLTFDAEITMEGMALGIDIEDQSVKRQGDEAVMRKIGLSESEANIFKGKTETVTAEIYYTDGSTAEEYGGLTIESSDNNVATAVIDGNTITITAVEAGTATITVKINENVYATISVNVVYVTGVTFTENETEVTEITLGAAGDTTEITANVTLSDGTEYSGGWTWTTDAGEVATVEKVQTGTILKKDTNKATVTAAGDGTATITLTLDDGSAWTIGVTVGGSDDTEDGET